MLCCCGVVCCYFKCIKICKSKRWYNYSFFFAEENDFTRNIESEDLLKRVHKINKGYALIVHNRLFDNLPTREGSEEDVDAIKSFCKEANLKIDVQENLEEREIYGYCRVLTRDRKIFRNYDGFVCFILSHGNR